MQRRVLPCRRHGRGGVRRGDRGRRDRDALQSGRQRAAERIGHHLERLVATNTEQQRSEIGIAEGRLEERRPRGPLLSSGPRIERRHERELRVERSSRRDQRERRRRAALRAATLVEATRAELLQACGTPVGRHVVHRARERTVERALVGDAAQPAARRRGKTEATRRHARVVDLDDSRLEPARRAVGAQLDRGGTTGHDAPILFPIRSRVGAGP